MSRSSRVTFGELDAEAHRRLPRQRRVAGQGRRLRGAGTGLCAGRQRRRRRLQCDRSAGRAAASARPGARTRSDSRLFAHFGHLRRAARLRSICRFLWHRNELPDFDFTLRVTWPSISERRTPSSTSGGGASSLSEPSVVAVDTEHRRGARRRGGGQADARPHPLDHQRDAAAQGRRHRRLRGHRVDAPLLHQAGEQHPLHPSRASSSAFPPGSPGWRSGRSRRPASGPARARPI